MAEPKVHNASTYTNHRCRCDICRADFAKVMRRARERRIQQPTPDHVHGTDNGYCNYGCRCEECTEAHRLAVAATRKRAA